MKSSGFNIEDTHMRGMERLARLVAMVCIAPVWAYLVGEHKDIKIKPIKILKHGRKAKSLVKYELEEISPYCYVRLTPNISMSSNFCHVLNYNRIGLSPDKVSYRSKSIFSNVVGKKICNSRFSNTDIILYFPP